MRDLLFFSMGLSVGWSIVIGVMIFLKRLDKINDRHF